MLNSKLSSSNENVWLTSQHEYTLLLYLTEGLTASDHGETVWVLKRPDDGVHSFLGQGGDMYEPFAAVAPKFGRLVVFRSKSCLQWSTVTDCTFPVLRFENFCCHGCIVVWHWLKDLWPCMNQIYCCIKDLEHEECKVGVKIFLREKIISDYYKGVRKGGWG